MTVAPVIAPPGAAPVAAAGRVWFNQGFSIRDAIAQIRAAAPGLTLIASSRRADSPALAAADERFAEPEGLDPDAYAAWCLATARARRVDLLVPGRQRAALARHAGAFAEAGIRLALPADAATLARIEDKQAFTEACLAIGLPVPATCHVTDAAGFAAAVARLRDAGHQPCIKPRQGTYGAGYWRLADDKPLFHRLMDPDARLIPTATIAAAIAEAGTVDLLVLEYLPGLETSVDCLARDGRLLAAVSRRKEGSVQRLRGDGPAIDLAARAVAAFGLGGLINVQMRENAAGALTLLEINPRMSGGCLYTREMGINLPWWFVALELGLAGPEDVPAPDRGERLVAAITLPWRLPDAEPMP